ncbi:MAG: hypothetical protein CSA20_01605 [Deltaproteobacteria bacterium]|nr:MAG: hypothetical protein CSA20_01605 [Deltaproteobacteria bacterium]
MAIKLNSLFHKKDLDFWENIFSMAGSACLAVAFLNFSAYSVLCSIVLIFGAYRIRQKRSE